MNIDLSDLTQETRWLCREFAMRFLPLVESGLACRMREANPPSRSESLGEKINAGRRLIMAEVFKQFCNVEVDTQCDAAAIAEEIAAQVAKGQQHPWLKWYANGRVRVLVGTILPEGSAVKQTLAARRKRLRAAVRERLGMERWEEISVHVYRPWATKHKQVRVKDGDFEADIDEELAPLIRELWEADLATVLSCQENRPGIVWIMFLTAGDLAEFLGIVAAYQPECESLYRRILADTDVEGCWEYDVSPVDDALHEGRDGIADWHEGATDFYFHASVRFPRTDLPILLDRMVQHNAFIRMLKSEPTAQTPQ